MKKTLFCLSFFSALVTGQTFTYTEAQQGVRLPSP